MNFDSVEIYNAGALEPIAGLGESGFVRVPESVRNALNDRARFVAIDSVGCEVRFVTDAPNIDITVAVQKPEFAAHAEMRVFKGNFLYQTHEIEPGVVTNIRLTPPERFSLVNHESLNEGGFSSRVWRIVFNKGTFIFHGIDTHGYEIRPPESKEKPSLNWLAYGSSITNSSLDGYIHIAARKLKVQVQNKGMSGACHMEKEMVDYLVDQCSWDFATCELGINMLGNFTPEEFEKRAIYLIDRFTATGKPVLIISVFPSFWSAAIHKVSCAETERESAFNRILPELVNKKQASNLFFMNGYEVLSDFTGISCDLVHPTAYGHALMGFNLAERLNGIL
jgi:hypothetical protein